jgi:putative colanic acid biosynthesis acetyltransferase WcaF
MISHHDSKNLDPYLHPRFSTTNRLHRFLWKITWTIFCKWTPNPLHKWRISFLRLFGAKIGKKNFIYPNSIIWAPWLLKTGDVVTIGPKVEIYNPGGIRLGHHAILSQEAYMCGATHDYNSLEFDYIKREISIEPYAWICAKAVVLPGVTCMEGSVLGAGSVTSRNLEPWTVYAGNPATPIKKRTNSLLYNK